MTKRNRNIKNIFIMLQMVPILWRIRSRHRYKTILKKCCMAIWHLRFLPCGFLRVEWGEKIVTSPCGPMYVVILIWPFYKLIMKYDPFANALLVPFYYPHGPTTIVLYILYYNTNSIKYVINRSSTYANILKYNIQGMPTNIILQVFI